MPPPYGSYPAANAAEWYQQQQQYQHYYGQYGGAAGYGQGYSGSYPGCAEDELSAERH